MRISSTQFHNTGFGAIEKHQSALLEIQEKMSSGKRINRPGDDPIGMNQVHSLNFTMNHIDQYSKNGEMAKSSLVLEETAISDSVESLQRARELSLQMMNGTYSAQNRQATSNEIGQIILQVKSMMNYTNSDGEKIFAGNNVNVDAAFVEDTVNVPVNNSSGDPLLADNHFFAYIGSQNAGADYDERANFGARYIQIGFDNDNNVAPNDLGDPSRVKITDNGSDVFNLPNGGTSLPPGVDGNILNVLVNMKDHLDRGLPPPDETADDLKAGIEQLTLARSEIGGRQNRIESQYFAGESFKLALEERRMQIEDMDIVKGTSDFTQTQTALQMAQQVFSQVNSLSLFNYFR